VRTRNKTAAKSNAVAPAPPFSKILIANRGEIACRVIRTCKRMGIKTVAVYSDADADALHVREADEAVRIGPPPSAQSYLNIEAIVGACKQTGAQAVHPGYGFLSEREAFAEALEQAGVVFIGPNRHAVAAMGDKIESKKLALAAKVSTVPGHLVPIKDGEEAVQIARKIGYPVMLKASAGGGGKGMRIAHNDAEAREGFRSATNEAKSSFDDDRVFAEKYIEEPRHIEIQVIGDVHGQVVHLGERECSIQRRHQKVIEESPSPFLDAKTRAAMGAQAVALAKAVQYRSAGTVEFIVDRKRNFYFLEMNTRLQVEHPVTECVTGLDLVELMIRVAAGEKLPLAQKDVKLTGWAIEARVYAEDPLRNFLPSIGRLARCLPPAQMEGVRVDTGVVEGSEISMFYDPMIAKVIGFADTREAAADRLLTALDAYCIRGLNHNVAFIAAIMAHPRFREGRLSTNFIAEEFPDGFKGRPLDDRLLHTLAAVGAVVQRRQGERETQISGQLAGHERQAPARLAMKLNGTELPAQIVPFKGGYAVGLGERTVKVTSEWRPGQPLFIGAVDGAPVIVQVDRWHNAWRLFHAGCQVEVTALLPRIAEFARLMPERKPPDTSRFLLSPMPGLLKAIAVKEGQDVKAGEELAVVEAMKMENVLRSSRDGTVGRLHARPGDSLAVDQKILEFA
jgi:propionyl-CoA carboxylase alpha chain